MEQQLSFASLTRIQTINPLTNFKSLVPSHLVSFLGRKNMAVHPNGQNNLAIELRSIEESFTVIGDPGKKPLNKYITLAERFIEIHSEKLAEPEYKKEQLAQLR